MNSGAQDAEDQHGHRKQQKPAKLTSSLLLFFVRLKGRTGGSQAATPGDSC